MKPQVHTNTFIKGMDKDTSKQKYENTKYENLRNGRPITDKGLSTRALENIKGNAVAYDFPLLKSFMYISATPLTNDSPLVEKQENVIIDFDASYPTSGNAYFSGVVTFHTGEEYLTQIAGLVDTFNTTVGTGEEIKYYKVPGGNNLVLYTEFVHFNGIILQNYSPYASVEVANDFLNFKVIGSTVLRERLLLFTVNKQGPLEYGQIWENTYDSENPLGTQKIVLKYNQKLNLSEKHPIEALSYRENEDTELLYWTDNFHPPRKINLADQNAMALIPDELLLSSKSQLYPAMVSGEEQSGGLLPSGIYYLTYKLEKFGGNITNIAPFSNYVPLIADVTSTQGTETNYENTNYPETTIGTEKSLRYLIPNIPKGFDKIYVYVVYQDAPSNQLAYLVEEKLIGNTSSLELTISSLGDKPKVTVSSLFSYDIDFEKVKTMATKDSRLLFGNVKHAAFDLDFDARAYRFNANGDSYTPISSGKLNWGIDLEENVINPENDDRTANLSPDDYSYQTDGVTRGGEGPNIKYEFTTKEVILDSCTNAAPTNTSPWTGYQNLYKLTPIKTPFINQPIKTTDLYDIENNIASPIEIDLGPGFRNFKNTRWEHYYKGYMRDEIYRFGIVFYSLTGSPSEVKWIADIRMPIDSELSATNPDSVLCRWWGKDGTIPEGVGLPYGIHDVGRDEGNTLQEYKLNYASVGGSLGVKFTVDVSSLSGKISGYSIVRSPREEKDRTILAEGAIGEVRKGVFGGDAASTNTLEGELLYNHTDVNEGNFSAYSSSFDPQEVEDVVTFDAPDLKFMTGARIRDYEGGETEEKSYYLKPVAGYVHIDESDTGLDVGPLQVPFQIATPIVDGAPVIGTPTVIKPESIHESLGGAGPSAYCKSLLRIFGVGRNSRLNAVKEGQSFPQNAYGKLEDIKKVESNTLESKIQGQRFSNRGNPLLISDTTGGAPVIKAILAGPGVFTVLGAGNPSKKMAWRILNESFGYTNLTTKPHEDNKIGNFSWSSNNSDISRKGHTAIVDLCRLPNNQYGGNTYLARQNSEYITTGNYVPVNTTDTELSTVVFGGDIAISAFGEKKIYEQAYLDLQGNQTTQDPESLTISYVSHLMGRIFPVQTIGNIELRTGFEFNNYIQGGGGDISLRRIAPDEYLLPVMYHKEKTLQHYLVEGAGNTIIGEFDTRVYMSELKINGELSDSWSSFKPLNYIDVDGPYGPINKLEVLNRKIIFFQDHAHGTVDLNPRSLITDLEGGEIELGTGAGLVDFTYASNTVGAFHQWGVLKGNGAIYFFDAYHKKMYKIDGQGVRALSDQKSMSSYFFNNIVGSVLNKDNSLLFEGIATTFDYRFNEAIFTFHTKVGLYVKPSGEINTALKEVVKTEYSDRVLGIVSIPLGGGISIPYYLANLPVVCQIDTTGEIYDINHSLDTYQLNFDSTADYNKVISDLNAGCRLQIYDGSSTDPILLNKWVNAQVVPGFQSEQNFQIEAPVGYFKYVFSNNLTDTNLRYRTVTDDINFNNIVEELNLGYNLQIKDQYGIWREATIKSYTPDSIILNLGLELENTFPAVSITSEWPIELRTIAYEYVSPEGEVITTGDDDTRVAQSITLVFNEAIDAFSSFYDHYPPIYMNDTRRIFSQVPKGYRMYIHDEGRRQEFYGVPFPMTLDLVVSPKGDWTKVFNNVEFFTILENELGEDIFNETFQELQIYNEYQDTGTTTLVPNTNVKRRMRTWRLAIPRDSSGSNARIRNPYVQMFLKFLNTTGVDRRFVVHDINTHYIDVPM